MPPNYINYGMSKNIIYSQKLVLLIMREHNIILSLNLKNYVCNVTSTT